jgi:hypothetical protein
MPDAVWLTGPSYSASYDIQQGRIDECGTCGSYVPYRNKTQHENFHKTFSNSRSESMSNVLWCDPGDHAFKAGSPGALHFQGTETDENGRTVSSEVDACAKHNPFRADPEVIKKELLSEYPIRNSEEAYIND